MALKEHDVKDDWLEYRLHLTYRGQEGILRPQERLAIIYEQLEKEEKQPALMLRKISNQSK
jgi:hypothetical protein